MKSEVFNIDCMEAMAEMGDNAFDLAIVDPPYGIGEDGGKTYQRPSRPNAYVTPAKHAIKHWDDVPTLEYWKELFRVSVNQIVCGANYFTDQLPARSGWIFWDKNIGGDFSDGELLFTSFDRGLRKWFGHPFLQTNGGKSRIHPTQKPVALYKWLLTNYAKPGQTILDTHLGSGSSRIAAYDLGFDFTGYELDKDYFEAQERRFADHIAQPKLFAPMPVIETQEGLF